MYKKPEPLEEKLERATKAEIGRLSRQMAEDPELKRMLTTPMRDVPQYQYLYSDPIYDQHPLRDAIGLFIAEGRQHFYFSKVGNKFTGFIIYEDDGRVVHHVKTASFKDDRIQTNLVLAKDLIEFVLEMVPQRDAVEWLVDPKNEKAIRQYNALLDRKGFDWRVVKDGRFIKYTVTGMV
jgi:hypothetical protein